MTGEVAVDRPRLAIGSRKQIDLKKLTSVMGESKRTAERWIGVGYLVVIEEGRGVVHGKGGTLGTHGGIVHSEEVVVGVHW